MKISTVKAYVKEAFIEQFIEATLKHHANTLRESGNVRFDFLQSEKEPTMFLFYEVYESDEAIALHRENQSYLTWRDAVADWMEKPREGVRFKPVAPNDISMWRYP